jgi:hypothetical protein
MEADQDSFIMMKASATSMLLRFVSYATSCCLELPYRGFAMG